MNYQRIGALITDLRNKKNMSQTHLARKLNVSPKTVSKWENGHGLPHIDTLYKLCEILDVDINELLSSERINSEQFDTDTLAIEADELRENKAKKAAKKRMILYCTMTAIQVVFTILSFLFMYLLSSGEGTLTTDYLAIAFTIDLAAAYVAQLIIVSIFYRKANPKLKQDKIFLAISIVSLPVSILIYAVIVLLFLVI